METTEKTGLSGFIESVGGADMFIWLVVFGVLIVFVLVMAYLNRDAERD
ncbi:MAG: hypothetical protein R3302_00025 [Sulfurimonadaceae bacterium]|nr:hypothetical protein [Sulfurimonadaceae bacterium]